MFVSAKSNIYFDKYRYKSGVSSYIPPLLLYIVSTKRRFRRYETTACLQRYVITMRINFDKGFTIVSMSSSFIPMNSCTFAVIYQPDGWESNIFTIYGDTIVSRYDRWLWILKNNNLIALLFSWSF